MSFFVKKLTSCLDLDKAVLWGIAAKLSQFCLAPLTAFLVILFLTIEQQGTYYFFASLIALRAFFELGAGLAITQVSSALRKIDDTSKCEIDPNFTAFINRWFVKICLLYFVVVSAAGSLYLWHADTLSTNLIFEFVLMVGGASWGMCLDARLALMMGNGDVVAVNRLRFVSYTLQCCCQSFSLWCGLGLFSFPIGVLVANVLLHILILADSPWVSNFTHYDESTFRVLKDRVFRLGRNTAKVFCCGYLVNQVQQPLCFHFLGAAASARFGFTNSVLAMILGLGSVWLVNIFPELCKKVSSGNSSGAFSLYRQRFFKSVLAVVISVTALLLFIPILSSYFTSLAERVYSFGMLIVISGAFVVKHFAMGLTYWPRAFEEEPFTVVAASQAVYSVAFFFLGIIILGEKGIGVALISSWLIGLGHIYSIFKKYRAP